LCQWIIVPDEEEKVGSEGVKEKRKELFVSGWCLLPVSIYDCAGTQLSV